MIRVTDASLPVSPLVSTRLAVLAYLMHGPASGPEISEAIGAAVQTVGDSARQLVKVDYVALRPDRRWEITKAGAVQLARLYSSLANTLQPRNRS